jgi:hypothetical protein
VSVANAQASAAEPAPPDPERAEHLKIVCGGLERGMLTPVLGAGASLFGRSAREVDEWDGAPSAEELAVRLARAFELPSELESSPELATVAQWIAVMKGGSMQLYDELHRVFDRDFPTTPLHEFLAETASKLRRRGDSPPLLVTTNYDDLIERALEKAGEPYDLIVYMAEYEHHGNFFHQPFGGSLSLIERPRDYREVNPDERTTVLKLHGFVNRRDRRRDSYVITEDHYIEYVSRSQLDELLPNPIVSRLSYSHLLFLGYSLRDWNLRAILYQLLDKQNKSAQWFAVRKDFAPLEERTWRRHNVEMIASSLEAYLDQLRPACASWLERHPGPVATSGGPA